MDNKPATGRDLMAQIYNVKRHVSYDKRAKNDQAIKAITEKFQDYKGETML